MRLNLAQRSHRARRGRGLRVSETPMRLMAVHLSITSALEGQVHALLVGVGGQRWLGWFSAVGCGERATRLRFKVRLMMTRRGTRDFI